MEVIRYNVNSTDVLNIGQQYEHNASKVVFSGYAMKDPENEMYFKFMGRTAASRYLIPIVDMTLDIINLLTKNAGTFKCQLEERTAAGDFVDESPIFRVHIGTSIKAMAEHEIVDYRLPTLYTKYNELYNTINHTSEEAIASEAERRAQWATLKNEIRIELDAEKLRIEGEVHEIISDLEEKRDSGFFTGHIKTDLVDYNAANLLYYMNGLSNKSQGGVTFTPNSDGTITVSADSKTTGNAVYDFFNDKNALPSCLKKGQKYFVEYASEKVTLRIYQYTGGTYKTGVEAKTNREFTLLDATDGMVISFLVSTGTAAFTEVLKPVIRDTMSNKELENKINTNHSEIIEKTDDIINANISESVSASGNPIVLKNTAELPYEALVLNNMTADTAVTICGKNIFHTTSDMVRRINNGVTWDFDGNTIKASSMGATGNSLSSGDNFPAKYGKLNGIAWWHNFKFKFANDTVVTVSQNCSIYQSYDTKIAMVLGLTINGSIVNQYINQNGFTFIAKSGIEYGIRCVATSGFVGTVEFRPQIEISDYASPYEPFNGTAQKYSVGIGWLKNYGSKSGITTIYTDDSSTITATAKGMKKTEKADAVMQLYNNIEVFNRQIKRKQPMISWIDDDTSSVELVRRYHDLFASKGVVGNFAVMTKNLDDNTGLADLLKQYEQEGFGMCYHCYWQSGDSTRYWESGNAMYDEARIKENFIRGLRAMQQYGFSNYKHWVTPYGVNDEFIKSLAKAHGMECLFTMTSELMVNSGHVNMFGNTDRYNIPRISVSSSSNDARSKLAIDSAYEDGGWIVMVTHANTWGSGSEVDNKVANTIQYAKDKGFKTVSVSEGFETFKSSFVLNDLFGGF